MRKTRLEQDDRINLQAGIAKGRTLAEIAGALGKSRSTIYREIINNCVYRDCRHTCAHCKRHCTADQRAGKFDRGQCKDFAASECPRWGKFPYACNGCAEAQFCSERKRYYDCAEAEALSQKSRREPRTFGEIGGEDLKAIDSAVSAGVKKGQSLHHIYATSPALQAICCERTVRRYLYRGYLGVKAHELPRYVRFQHKYDYAEKRRIVNVGRMFGRTFSDYGKHMKGHPGENVWQYDSVEGKVTDKKAILTITYPEFRFQFGFLITKQSATSVLGKIRRLQKLLGERFWEIFQVNLSDNGVEFARFHEIEGGAGGESRCKTFFTNPYKATDKAGCERNHELVRYVIPKGVSMDFLTQRKVSLLFSHINSYARASNQNKTPYDLMVGRFGAEFMEIIGIKRVKASDVCLKPSLLK